MKKRYIIIFIVLITYIQTSAQTWTNYTFDDGLVDNIVFSIAIDPAGNKWCGTQGGGVSMFNDAIWYTYIPASGPDYYYVETIITDIESNIWFNIKNWDVVKFDGNNLISYPPPGPAECMTIDSKGNIWIGVFGKGVFEFNGINWTRHTSTDVLGYGIFSIAIDSDDNIWVATTYGISKFDGLYWVNYTTDMLTDSYVRELSIDLEGNKWCGTWGGGVLMFNDTIWIAYDTIDGLAGNSVAAITIDEQGNKWFGTEKGVSKFNGTIWTTYDTTDGLASNRVLAIAIDSEGNKWFGTSKGVSKLTDGGAGPLVLSKKIQKGVVFEDLNGNGKKDGVEQGIAGHKLLMNDKYITSNNNGMFYVLLNNGQHSLQYIKQGYWQTTTDTLFTFNVTDTTVLDTIYIGVKPDTSINDVSVYVTGTPTRANFTSQYWVNYKNLGSVTQQGVVEMKYDTLITLVNAVPSPVLHTGNVLTWNFDTLASLEHRQIYLQFKMPGVDNLGDTLKNTASIKIVNTDINTSNNSDILYQVITGSYDPNDKLVSQGVGTGNYVLHSSELEYTIRFQNTGTDTAFNVNIRDSIDLSLNIETLEILASSHPVQLELRGKNEAIFKFENILLPDSNVNEPGSHGFVKYSINPKKQLTDNTVTTNKAYIYFDFNPAIITNEVKNTYVSVIPKITSFQKIKESEKAISIYPNPSSGVFKITIETGHALSQPATIHLYDLMGKEVYSKQVTERSRSNHPSTGLRTRIETIDLSGYNKGIYMLRVQTDKAIETRRIVVR